MGGTRRLRALMVRCPKCGSPPNVACSGSKGARKAPHLVRMTASPSPSAVKNVRPVIVSNPESFYACDAWRQVRYQALRRSQGVCECCYAAPSPGKPLHVDHIKPRSKFPSLQLDVNNLQVLCADCNLGKSNRDDTDWRGSRASA